MRKVVLEREVLTLLPITENLQSMKVKLDFFMSSTKRNRGPNLASRCLKSCLTVLYLPGVPAP